MNAFLFDNLSKKTGQRKAENFYLWEGTPDSIKNENKASNELFSLFVTSINVAILDNMIIYCKWNDKIFVEVWKSWALEFI